MSFYFYLNERSEQQGPVSLDRFLELGLTSDTLVWKQGMDSWERAGSVAEIREYLKAHRAASARAPEPDVSKSPGPQPQASTSSPEPGAEARAHEGESTQKGETRGQSSFSGPNSYTFNRQAQPFYPLCPPSYLLWAILSTLCCCLPLGVVAIVKASQVSGLYQRGLWDQALMASEDAKRWCIYSAVSGLIVGFLCGLSHCFIFFFL